jgi:hypothetical protein
MTSVVFEAANILVSDVHREPSAFWLTRKETLHQG